MAVPTGLARRAFAVSLAAGVLYFGALLLFSVNALPMVAIDAKAVELGLIAAGLPMAAILGFAIWRWSHQMSGEWASRDELTGLQNRRAFEDKATRALDCARVGSVALVLFDVDGLRRLNDTCGHKAGDELLRQAARALRRSAGQATGPFRVGGDEFGLVLSRTRGAKLSSVARAVRPFDAEFKACGHVHHVSVSMGFASCTDGESFDPLLRRVQSRLDESKKRLGLARTRERSRPFMQLVTRETVAQEETEAQAGQVALA